MKYLLTKRLGQDRVLLKMNDTTFKTLKEIIEIVDILPIDNNMEVGIVFTKFDNDKYNTINNPEFYIINTEIVPKYIRGKILEEEELKLIMEDFPIIEWTKCNIICTEKYLILQRDIQIVRIDIKNVREAIKINELLSSHVFYLYREKATKELEAIKSAICEEQCEVDPLALDY